MKIGNIDSGILHIFSMNWGISMKFSEKMWLMMILKLTKKKGCTLSLEDTYFENHSGVAGKLAPLLQPFYGLG